MQLADLLVADAEPDSPAAGAHAAAAVHSAEVGTAAWGTAAEGTAVVIAAAADVAAVGAVGAAAAAFGAAAADAVAAAVCQHLHVQQAAADRPAQASASPRRHLAGCLEAVQLVHSA